MKKTIIMFFALAISAMSYCQEKLNPTAGSEIVYKVPKYVEPTWGEGDYELCPKDQWLRIADEMRSVQLVENLADAYNVLMVFHSVYSDYECHERHETSTAKGMQKMDISVISDGYSRRCADEFRNNMAKSQMDNNVDVDEVINKYFGEMATIYKLEKLMNDDSIFSEEVYGVAINHDSLRTDPFSRRCVEAMELAHDTVDGLPNEDALPKLVDVLTAGQYSPLLLEAWKTWRAMIANNMGHSKDSYIPNEEYNRLRMIVCYTTLCHIKDYLDDWVAVNNFLLMASTPNVAIFGQYPFGNQSVMVYYEMFPELYPASTDEE